MDKINISLQDLEDDISSVMQVRGEHCPPVSLDREVADLKNSFIYVSHQVGQPDQPDPRCPLY